MIKVDDVKVSADNEKLIVSIKYLLIVRQEKRYLNVEVAL